MVANSKIEWCHHTFNPWMGCTRVSPACDRCYAAVSTPARAMGIEWGPRAERRRTSASTWAQPLRWNREAARLGIRYRVFCASLADVLDPNAPDGGREDLWPLVEETTQLDWLFLTKRIGNARKMLPAHWLSSPPPNVWLGATIVNQEEADRDIPKLLMTPAAKRFLSMEPLLGSVDLENVSSGLVKLNALNGMNGYGTPMWRQLPSLDWIIVGGESGAGARPMHPDWARSLRDQCAAAGVPFLFKQWGEYGPYGGESGVAGAWLDPNGHYYGGPVQWPPTHDEPRAYMIRWGKKAAGRLLDGVRHDGVPA